MVYFYLLVLVFTALDLAMVVAMVWYGLKITGSTVLVGFTLCVSTLVPFFLEKWSGRQRVVQLTMKRLQGIRFVTLCGILSLALLIRPTSPAWFLSIALLIGMADYFTISTLEACNAKLCRAAQISGGRSARYMQTAIQIGAFTGAFAGGFVIDMLSARLTIVMISLLSVASLALAWLPNIRTQSEAEPVLAVMGTTAAPICPKMSRETCFVIMALGMIGFHIGGFNSLVPIIFQQLNGWNATEFGMASGLAGVGAFCAAIVPKLSLRPSWLVVGVILMDTIVAYSPRPFFAIAASLALGFCINGARITFRQILIEESHDSATADYLASRSAFYYLLLNSLAPLVLTLLATGLFWGSGASRILMVSAATGLCLTVVPVSFNSKVKSTFQKQLQPGETR